MMKFTNGQILTMREPMQQIMQIKWPVKTAFDLAKAAHAFNGPLTIIETTRQGLIRKHGEKDTDTGQIGIKPGTEAMKNFALDWAELLNQEMEVNFKRVVLPVTDAEIQPGIILALDGVVTMAEEEATV